MSRHNKLALAAGAAAFIFARPALAQHQRHQMTPGMQMPGMKAPPPKKMAPAKKKASAKKPASKTAKAPTKKPAVKKKATAKPVGHDMSSMPGMDMPGHDMPTPPGSQTPAGHDMSSMPRMQMPGHDMTAMPANADAEAAGTNLPAGNAPPPPIPSDHAADGSFPPAVMAATRHRFDKEQGGQNFYQVMFNLAEYQARKGGDGYEWNGEAWYGGDINRLWLKSEGDGTFGKSLDRAEIQALYSRAIDPYFNLQAGLRYDFKPNPSRVYATVGVEGVAPGMFDVEGALFLSNKGELMARAEGYYDQRLPPRLILQPRAELNFAAQNSPSIDVGAGLSDAELGLRLRYEIRREFAPYVGVQYSRAFGKTRRYLLAEGEDPGGWEFVAGVRTWF